MLHRVKDLSPDQKLAVEALLGRTVSNEEAVSVRAVVPASVIPSQLSKQERDQALNQIDAYFDKIDSRRKPVTEQEQEAIFVEAMRSVRPNYRPIE
jgi:signal transduction protein with GAF and PtsI domain